MPVEPRGVGIVRTASRLTGFSRWMGRGWRLVDEPAAACRRGLLRPDLFAVVYLLAISARTLTGILSYPNILHPNLEQNYGVALSR
jgi:hypothetical protein